MSYRENSDGSFSAVCEKPGCAWTDGGRTYDTAEQAEYAVIAHVALTH